jgi:CheY-like chemotaxis protein
MKKKALVVDDNANNLMLEKDLLDVAGFEVFVAENAAAGYSRSRSGQDITSRQRDTRYSHNFRDCLCNARRQRRDKRHT